MSLRGPSTLFRIQEGGQDRALCIEGRGSVIKVEAACEHERASL